MSLPTENSTLFLSDADVRAVFDWRAAVEALRQAYSAPADEARFPPRSMARGDGLWLRTLTGVSPSGDVMGAKMIAASMKASRASYLIPLFAQSTVELIALLDGASITGFRTAATSALAADVLTPPGPLRVAVIGSGFEAKTHTRAVAALRKIDRLTVFSPNPASRARFRDELADLAIAIDTAESAEAAVKGANLVICAARSRDESPTLCGAWLEPGQTVVSIGSTLPEQRELDSEAIMRADLIVADMIDEVAHDTGDMLAAKEAGVAFTDKLAALEPIIAGEKGRQDPDQIMLYKSVGGAIQDITVAALCAKRAVEAGIGTRLPVTIAPVNKGK